MITNNPSITFKSILSGFCCRREKNVFELNYFKEKTILALVIFTKKFKKPADTPMLQIN